MDILNGAHAGAGRADFIVIGYRHNFLKTDPTGEVIPDSLIVRTFKALELVLLVLSHSLRVRASVING